MILSDNRIKKPPTDYLKSLEVLNLSSNRISDIAELDKISAPSLKHVHASGNPINRDRHYRYKLLNMFRGLQVIDGQPVSEHERERSQALMVEGDPEMMGIIQQQQQLQQQQIPLPLAPNSSLQTLRYPNAAQMKITALSLNGIPPFQYP